MKSDAIRLLFAVGFLGATYGLFMKETVTVVYFGLFSILAVLGKIRLDMNRWEVRDVEHHHTDALRAAEIAAGEKAGG